MTPDPRASAVEDVMRETEWMEPSSLARVVLDAADAVDPLRYVECDACSDGGWVSQEDADGRTTHQGPCECPAGDEYRLRAALLKYGRHRTGCSVHADDGTGCDCGFYASMRERATDGMLSILDDMEAES